MRAHFCPECDHILSLTRHGDYFAFFGLPRRLVLDPADLEQRFRRMSRQFHPDFFHNAAAAERLASLERSSYLNDAWRVLKDPATRVEYLLGLEGLAPAKESEGGAARGGVPAALLEEVFAFNEELDEIRAAREAGGDPHGLRARLERAREPIERKQRQYEARLAELSAAWDASHRRGTLEELRELFLERKYLRNLMETIERELQALPA